MESGVSDVLSVEILYGHPDQPILGSLITLLDADGNKVAEEKIRRKEVIDSGPRYLFHWHAGPVTPIRSGGQNYVFEGRMTLEENTPGSPSGELEHCVRRSPANEGSCQLPQENSACEFACGSIGEVANDPTWAHHLPFHAGRSHDSRMGLFADSAYDDRYAGRMNRAYGRSIVWVARALRGEDQLRQRMAWAL